MTGLSCISKASFVTPADVVESAWLEHAPFAFWLVDQLRPRVIVELGTHNGFSYFCFCQALNVLDVSASCYAVDTWAGDEHAGFYNENTYQSVVARNEKYRSFSQLMRMRLDEALAYFPDNSIDLLHIDHRHFYDDVKADFESWRQKLSRQAIVLFHDTQVRERGFGVWKLFDELAASYPTFNFIHGHGLGVLALGEVPASLSRLFNATKEEAGAIRECYARLGSAEHIRWSLLASDTLCNSLRNELAALIENATKATDQHGLQLAEMKAVEVSLRSELAAQIESATNATKQFGLQLAERTAVEDSLRSAQRQITALTRFLATLRRPGGDVKLPRSLNIFGRMLHGSKRRQARDYRLLALSPLFDADWYRENNPEVLASGWDPILHYVVHGGQEGLRPSPYFDAAQYLIANPDLKIRNQNPLIHFLKHGASEAPALFPDQSADNGVDFNGKSKKSVDILRYLPRRDVHFTGPTDVTVDIIIPVYRGLDETRRCIETVLEDRDRPAGRVIVIDDCSPDPELSGWLDSVAAHGRIALKRNIKNLGFVGTVNRGMADAGENDVVLLNADTEVPAGWLRRLMAHAYSDDKIGSVTPFSNNATICSYPSIAGGDLPAGFSLKALDDACRRANGTRSVDIPTAVGFAMYIRRDCLNEVGLFDQEAFGRGYGEENDFCMRALARGWRHILACDTFVYHAGEVSFGKSSPERDKAWGILVARHPYYSELVRRHVALDPAAGARFSLTAALFRASVQPTVLLITHQRGGGTERHVQELIAGTRGSANMLLIRADKEGIELSVPAMLGHPVLRFANAERDKLLTMLTTIGVDRCHVHHWIDCKFDLQWLVDHIGAPFDLTIHDYYAICPQTNLLPSPEKPYCGEEGLWQCNNCIAQRPSHGAKDIVAWRSANYWLLNEAERVICPSQDTENRLLRYFPCARTVVAAHEPVGAEEFSVAAPVISAAQPLRVAILGHLQAHKGREVVAACLNAIRGSDVEFLLIGASIPALQASKLQETGDYNDADLSKLIAEAEPHVIWFPQTWPETYSYTLSAAIDVGLPILASNMGAFVERLAGRPLTWLQDPSSDVTGWQTTFAKIKAQLLARKGVGMKSARSLAPNFYPDAYLEPVRRRREYNKKAIIDIRRASKLTALVVPDRLSNGNISPCGYIRLLLPLERLASENKSFLFVCTTIEAALQRRADIFICQRHVVSDVALLDKVVKHCRQTGMRIVYDLDDELINISAEHPEREHLQRLAPVVLRMLREAEDVWVSTEELHRRVTLVRPNAVILRNLLDERLWIEPRITETSQSDPIRVLYMGTQTHDVDFAWLENIANQIVGEHEGVAFEIVGITSRSDFSASIRRVTPPSHATVSYPSFVAWLVSQNRWDVGVAPLIETQFSSAKSDIKVLDYAAMGLVVLASDVPAMTGTFGEADGVKVLPNDAAQWRTALEELISCKAACKTRGRLARAAFVRSRSFSAEGDQWSKALGLEPN